LLYFRRGGGKPVLLLGRGATEQGNRGVPLDDILSEHRWRTPLITTAYTHMEVFAAARLPLAQRMALMRAVPAIFRARWLPWLQQEVTSLRTALPALLQMISSAPAVATAWQARTLSDVLIAAQTILPEEDLSPTLLELTSIAGDAQRTAAPPAPAV
jgi:hypothetical protein